MVSVVEPDDGSGWVKVVDVSGKSGLVPASYIEAAEEEVATPAAQQHYGSGKYGQLYLPFTRRDRLSLMRIFSPSHLRLSGWRLGRASPQ